MYKLYYELYREKNYDTESIMMPLKVLFSEECNLV